jgi:hypothetical protein
VTNQAHPPPSTFSVCIAASLKIAYDVAEDKLQYYRHDKRDLVYVTKATMAFLSMLYVCYNVVKHIYAAAADPPVDLGE